MPPVAGFHQKVHIGPLDRQSEVKPLMGDFDDVAAGGADSPGDAAQRARRVDDLDPQAD